MVSPSIAYLPSPYNWGDFSLVLAGTVPACFSGGPGRMARPCWRETYHYIADLEQCEQREVIEQLGHRVGYESIESESE